MFVRRRTTNSKFNKRAGGPHHPNNNNPHQRVRLRRKKPILLPFRVRRPSPQFHHLPPHPNNFRPSQSHEIHRPSTGISSTEVSKQIIHVS